MSARRTAVLALAVAALAGGCKSTNSKPGQRLQGPSGLAVFNAVTDHADGALRPYLAVANRRGDDLRLLDPVDGAAVLAPALVLSLAIPTEARPALLAAGALGEDTAKPDLLVVASTGTSGCPSLANPTGAGRLSGCIQVVQTWAEPAGTFRTAVDADLSIALAEVGGAEDAIVLSMAVFPVTDASGGLVKGRARLAAGLDGGRLLLADFKRTAVAAAGDRIEADGLPVVLDLGFDPLSLSAAPGGSALYAATTDLLPAATPVHGVAEIDVRGPLSPTPRWRALDAQGPTTVVLAATARRFTGFRYTTAADASWDPVRDSHGAEVLRVYVARDGASCGRTLAVACGLAVLDPAGGGADGTGGLALETAASGPTADRYQHTIPLPGNIVALTALPPPITGGVCDDGTTAPCAAATNTISTTPYQAYYVGGASRYTSTLAAAVSDNGVVYLIDLGHDGVATGRDWLATSSTALHAHVVTATVATTSTTRYALALWNALAGPPATLTRDSAKALPLVEATPGFTPTDVWTVSWQGFLPGLTELAGQAQVDTDGVVRWIAIQRPTGLTGPTDPALTGVGNLWDPTFTLRPAVAGARIGDIVIVTAAREPGDAAPIDQSATVAVAEADQYCPFGAFELEVEALLPPSADYPGGAVKVREPSWANWVQPSYAFGDVTAANAPTANPRCMSKAAALVGQPAGTLVTKPVKVTFLAGELLVTGGTFGYAGRPSPSPAAGTPYRLQHDRTVLDSSCPALDTGVLPATCDETCRSACETLLLSRKARRFAYVFGRCASTDADCLGRWDAAASTTVNKLTFPNPGGPVLGLDLAWTLNGSTAATPDFSDSATWPPRGTLLSISTVGGLVVNGMTPKVSGVSTGTLLPSGVAAWNRPDFTKSTSDHGEFFVSYPANQIMTFSPTASSTDVKLIR